MLHIHLEVILQVLTYTRQVMYRRDSHLAQFFAVSDT